MRAGGLTATTYAICAGRPCVVKGSTDSQVVTITNDSPLQYYFHVLSRCVTDGIAYVGEGTQQSHWQPNDIHIDARRKSSHSSRSVSTRLVALRRRDNESIEVAISWSCVTYDDRDEFSAPLVIQVDAWPAMP